MPEFLFLVAEASLTHISIEFIDLAPVCWVFRSVMSSALSLSALYLQVYTSTCKPRGLQPPETTKWGPLPQFPGFWPLWANPKREFCSATSALYFLAHSSTWHHWRSAAIQSNQVQSSSPKPLTVLSSSKSRNTEVCLVPSALRITSPHFYFQSLICSHQGERSLPQLSEYWPLWEKTSGSNSTLPSSHSISVCNSSWESMGVTVPETSSSEAYGAWSGHLL